MSIIDQVTSTVALVNGNEFHSEESFWFEIQFKLGFPKSCTTEKEFTKNLISLIKGDPKASWHIEMPTGHRLIIELRSASQACTLAPDKIILLARSIAAANTISNSLVNMSTVRVEYRE